MSDTNTPVAETTAVETAPVVEQPVEVAEGAPSVDALAAELEAMFADKSTPTVAPVPHTPEVAPSQEEKAPPAEESAADRFAALVAKNKEILAAKQAEKELQAERQAAVISKQEREELALLRKYKELRSKDPIAALEALGEDPASVYADMTELSLRGTLTPREQAPQDVVQTMRAEMQALREEIYQTQLESERALALAQSKEVVASDPDRWAFVSANGAEAEVWNLIEMQYAHDGTTLDFAQAADMVEHYLASEAEKQYALYTAATNRKKSLNQAQTPQPQTPVSKPAHPPTLTNSMSMKTPPSVEDDWVHNEFDEQKRKEYMVRELENMMNKEI